MTRFTFTATNVRPRVAMVGDSITQSGNWNALLPSFDVINFGVTGNTSAEVLDRVGPVIQSNAHVVALLIGTNDLGKAVATSDEVIANTDRLVRELEAVSMVIMHTVPPRQTEYGHDIQELNQGLTSLADSHERRLIDLWSLLDRGDGTLLPSATTDGLHLNDFGYGIWTTALESTLSSMLL